MTTRRRPPTAFWGNKRVSHQVIIAQQRLATLERMGGEARVLLLEDTTSYNFSQHPATVGLGPLENENCWGFLAHSTLAVSEVGVPLGVIEQVVWARSEGARSDRHQRAFEDKESYKWVQALPDAATQAALPQAIVVSDRESHIYEYLDELVDRGLDFVVRAMQGRGFTLDGQDVFAALSLQPVQAHLTLSLPRRPDREARQAEVEFRFTALTLKRPRRSTARRENLMLYALEVSEPQPPSLHQATRWIAQLGGFLARKGDGEPGVKVLWRGWTRLQDIAATWSLLHPPLPDVGNA
jgi:hypothetical protein